MKAKLTLGLILTLAMTSTLFAQAGPTFGFQGWGPRAGLTVNPDQIHFGAHILIGSTSTPVIFQPNFEIGFGDDFTLFTLNGDVLYTFKSVNSPWVPALGGELGFSNAKARHDGSESDMTLSIVGNVAKTLVNGNQIFFEAKIGVANAPDFKATVGYTLF